MPVQHSEQEAQALRVESLREPARVLRGARIDERLHLDEHGPCAFARHERDAARHGRAVPREEDRGRVLNFPEAVLCHQEEAHLVRRTISILRGAHDPEAAADVALEIQDRVDHVLEHARPRERALLGHVADEQRRDVAFLREAQSLITA